MPEDLRDALGGRIHRIAANQVAVAGLAAVVEFVPSPGDLFANQVPNEVEASYAEQEDQPDEALQQQEVAVERLQYAWPAYLYSDGRAVWQLGPMHLADRRGADGVVVEFGVDLLGRMSEFCDEDPGNLFARC